jgi:hypothetical protein
MKLRVLALCTLVACTFHVPVDPVELSLESLRLGETDFVQLVRATDAVRFRGRATLRPGMHPLDNREYEAMEIAADTHATFEADVGLRGAEQRGGQLVVTPDVRSFELGFDRPIVLHGRGGGRRVTLQGARYGGEGEEGQRFEVDVKVGRSLVGSIASAVVGVPGGATSTSALDAVARVEVSELTATLRAGSTLTHGASTLVVAEPSGVVIRRLDVDVDARTARFEIEGALDLGAGTCVVTEQGRLCSDAVRLELLGDYSYASDTTRLRLSQMDRPTRLVARAGRLEGNDGASILDLTSATLVLDRYECAGGETLACAYDVRADLAAGAGAVGIEGSLLRFDALDLRAARIEQSPTGGSVRIEAIALRGASLALAQGEGAASARFSELVLGDVQGAQWGQVALVAGSLVARAGEVRVVSGGAELRGVLAGETRVELGRRDTLELGRASETGESRLRLRATLDELGLEVAGRALATARGLAIDADVGPRESRAELTVREDVRIAGNAFGELALGDVRLGFRALRWIRDAESERVETEGLRLALPQAQLLAALRPHVPASIVGDEKPVPPNLEAALGGATNATRLGTLSRFRSRLDVAGLDALTPSFERGRLRVRGDVDVTVKLLADEHRTELRTCTQSLVTTVPVPCFRDGLPALCDERLQTEIPYPCLASEDVTAEVLAGTFRVNLDVSGEVRSNAPAALADLALTAQIARCDRVNLVGMNDTLERALDVEGSLCGELTRLGRTIRLGDLLDVASIPLLQGARVRRLDFESDGTDVMVALDVSVELPTTVSVVQD